MSGLKRVGFWEEKVDMPPFIEIPQGDEELPDVRRFVDPRWLRDNPMQVGAVVWHLTHPRRVHAAYKGWSTCRLCGVHNGSEEWTDDVWVWPSGLVHYVMIHQVKPPQEFIDHVEQCARRTP